MAKRVTRREFIQGAALTAAGVALGACKPAATPTPPPAPTKAPPAAVPTKAPPTAVPPPTKPPIVEITLSRYEHPAQPIRENAPGHLAITEHTGVKVKFSVVPQADYAQKQQLWLSTKQVPDLLHVNSPDQLRDFAKPDIILPIMPLVDKYAPHLKQYIEQNKEMKKYTNGGVLYYIPAVLFNWKKLAPMPLIRKDLLDKAGLPEPKSMEELFETLKELKKANPGTLGITCRNGTKWLLVTIGYPMGTGLGAQQWYYGPYYDHDLKRWQYGPIHPEFADMLDYFAKAYKEGILDPDFAATTTDQWHQKNSAGKGLFSWDNMSFLVRWNLAIRQQDPSATWGAMPTLSFKKFHRGYDYSGLYDGWAIGANTKYPDRVIQLLDWMVTPFGIDLTNWGIEGKHFTRKKPLPEKIDDYTEAGLVKALPKDRNELLPEVWKEYSTKSDPFRTYQSDVGVGQLDFNQIYDHSVIYLWDPPGEMDAAYAMLAADTVLKPRGRQPSLEPAESERVKKIQADCEAIMYPAFDKVILGQWTLSDYDKAVQEAKKAGAEDWEKILNEAEARLA